MKMEMEVKSREWSLHFTSSSRVLLQKGAESPSWNSWHGVRAGVRAPAISKPHRFGPCRSHGFQESGVLISLQEEPAAGALSRRVNGRPDGLFGVVRACSAQGRPSIVSTFACLLLRRSFCPQLASVSSCFLRALVPNTNENWVIGPEDSIGLSNCCGRKIRGS